VAARRRQRLVVLLCLFPLAPLEAAVEVLLYPEELVTMLA